MIGAASAMALAFATPSGAANGEVWTRAVAPNGAFSIETPCTAAEVAALRVVPDAALPISNYAPQTRIACKKGPLVFMAGVIDTNDLPAGVSAYDYITEMVERRAKTTSVQGKPTATTIGGRRAMINRGETNGIRGQTGFIEIGPRRIITLVAGTRTEGVDAAASFAAIDRFYASIEVAG